MLISKEEFHSWREIQDIYEGFKASLGPWNAEEVTDYLKDEYPDLRPSAEIQVGNLVSGSNQTVRVAFNG